MAVSTPLSKKCVFVVHECLYDYCHSPVPSAPSAPLNVTAHNISSTSIMVTWEPPMMPNGIIRLYHIEVTKIGDDDGSEFPSLVVNVTGTETSVVIGMLEIFTSYEIQVFAVTVSEGEPSNVVVVTTDEDSELFT